MFTANHSSLTLNWMSVVKASHIYLLLFTVKHQTLMLENHLSPINYNGGGTATSTMGKSFDIKKYERVLKIQTLHLVLQGGVGHLSILMFMKVDFLIKILSPIFKFSKFEIFDKKIFFLKIFWRGKNYKSPGWIWTHDLQIRICLWNPLRYAAI